MKKEQLKEAVGELNCVDTVFEADGVSYIDTAVSVMQVYDLIDQLDEPRKVVIPQIVAEAFEKAKWDNNYVEQLITSMYESSDEVGYWLELPTNEKLLLRAWLDGYEVEKEKLYYIYDKSTKSYLGYNADKTRLSWYTSKFPNDVFTEQEIKEIDERYWAFAEEVAE